MKSLLAGLVAAGLLAFVGAGWAGEKDAPKTEGKGTLTLGGKTYQLANALAYEQTVFRKKEIAVILSEKPLDTAKLLQSLKKNGNDDDFFPTQVHVKLSLDGAGELLQLSVHAGGDNIIRSGDRNIKTSAAVKDGSVKGTAGTKTDDQVRDKTFKFDVTFDVAVIQAARTSPEPKPPQDPKPKKTKSTPRAPNQPPLATEKELRFEGTLADDSPRVMGKPAQIHRVNMSPDKTYVIDLESNDFDAYLRILDSAGKQLAKDDDGGDGLNARIRFTPPKEDNYQVVATRFGSDQGNYVLKIRTIDSEPKRKTKATLTVPGQPQLVTEKELRIEGTLANNSPRVMGKPAQIHRVTMSPDKTYVIDLESNDFDAYLRILDSTGKQLASDDDGGEGFNARIRFTPPKEDNYQVVATRYASGQGNYVLKIRVLRAGEE
jgi:hypothetical protein